MTANFKQPDQAVTALRISVAMATYNGEKFIREQLDSIARQTAPPMEIVIADDGSTDATMQIVEDFSRTVSFPVRVFRNEARLGYADNFFKAASLCAGDVIAFCDQDDIWMENKLGTCSAFFADARVVMAAHSAQTLLESGERGHNRPSYPRTRILEPGSSDPFDYPSGFAILIRRELLNAVKATHRPQKLFAHDQWFWFLAAALGKIAVIADVLALYRQHQANTFGAGPPPSLRRHSKYILQTVDYDELADAELACSKMLITAAEQSPDLGEQLRVAATQIELRSGFHRTRTEIFRNRSTFFHRAAAFTRILLLGGYLPDQSKTRLGLRAAVKDLLLGVLGVVRANRKDVAEEA